MLRQKAWKIGVLGQDDGVCLTGCLEDLNVLGISESQITNGDPLNVKSGFDPIRDERQSLRINPNDHAATTGCATSFDAY